MTQANSSRWDSNNTTVAENWNDLNDILFGLNPEGQRSNRARPKYVFRGVVNSGYGLRSSLSRFQNRFDMLETSLLRNFKKYADPEVIRDIPSDSFWDWLSLAQHHGLPTRLLDWTFSPFVAMHFATDHEGKLDDEGAIWCANYGEATKLLPPVLSKLLDKTKAGVFSTEMLRKFDLAKFDGLAKDPHPPFVLFFEPPSFDARIVNQYALFSIVASNKIDLEDLRNTHPWLIRKVLLPKEVKREVRNKLDQANITERMLFPGLDGLSNWLKRYYGKKI